MKDQACLTGGSQWHRRYDWEKWNELGFRPLLCTYRLNWVRRTSCGWWDEWDDTVLQTQDSKFVPWWSEAEHATSRSRRLLTILSFTRGWGTEPQTREKTAVLTTTIGPPPMIGRILNDLHIMIGRILIYLRSMIGADMNYIHCIIGRVTNDGMIEKVVEYLAGPVAHSVRLWLETQKYWVWIPAWSNVRHRGYAYRAYSAPNCL